MPTYVYKFVDTGETIELQQAFTDETLSVAVHPRTGETMPVKKVFQPIGVTFKGGGFYKTDSRKGSTSKSSTATPAAESSSSDSSSTTSDSSSSSTASTASTSSTSSTSESSKPAPSSKSSGD